MEIDILIPSIFPKDKLLAGVTLRNITMFPEIGFSVHQVEHIPGEESSRHRQLLADQLKIPVNSFKCNRQVHENNIVFMGKTTEPTDADGIITNEKNLVIYVKLADCAGILLYDPQRSTICALHSGWKGTMCNIAGLGVKKLYEEFQADPLNILAYVTPCASGKNYEVGWDVARYFPDHITESGNGKFLFDNRTQIKSQLIEAGLQDSNIEISELCTIENTNCHSFRRDKEKSGRMAAFIALK